MIILVISAIESV